MDKYKVFLYKCDPTNISGDIATALWALLVQLPFNIFSFILQLLVYVLKVLNLGNLLSGLQNSMIDTSKTVFLSLIGGAYGSIGNSSLVGLAVVLMAGYLLYQFTNGKGHFISSLLHFITVFALVFFYFGNFSGGNVKLESGGEFLFQTVEKVTTDAQSEISKALNPTLGSNDPTTVFTNYLKDTANYINTGNTDGKLSDGSSFDYGKASGSDGDSYISDIGQSDTYVQANNDVLVQKITFGLTQSLDAYVMVLPMAVIDILVSVLNLVLLVLILLFPLTAALSFFPFFRNAAMNGLKKMLLLTALPAGLSIVLSIILYMLGQVDAPVAQAVTAAKVPNGFSFLVTLIVELALKAVMLYGLWHYRDSVLDFLTGGVVSEQGLGNQLKDGLKQSFDTTAKVGSGAKEAAEGGLLLGGGTAMMAGGGLGVLAGNVFGQEELAAQFSDFMRQGKHVAGSGLGHFVPEGLKNEFQIEPEPDETTHENEKTTPDYLAKEPDQNPTVEPLSESDDSTSEQAEAPFEDFQAESEEGLEPKEAVNPFVLSDNDGDLETQTAPDASNVEVSPEAEHFDSSQAWESPVFEEAETGEWQGAIQDLSAERGGF